LREISEALLARGGWKGKVIGLPWRVGTENLCVYRKDLFEKYGVEPPDKSIKSLDDLVEVARKLNHPPDHYATALALAGYKATDTEFERYFWDLGGRIVNEDETDVSDYDRNAPLAVKLIETWKTLIKEKLIPAGAVGEVVLDKLTDYMQGKVAMFMEYSARAQVIEDPASSKVPGLSGWTLIFTDSKDAVGPRGSYSYGWLIGINPNSTQDEKEAAYKVCEWFVSFEAQYKAATQYANAPVRTDVLTDSAFAEGVPSARANAESMKTAYGMRLAEAPKIEKIVADEVDAAIAGKKETEDAVSEIWKQVHALLKPG
jgi:multiple sugar transport system substrate-binding protein